MRVELKLEAGGQPVHFKVEDYWARDFRVPPESPMLKAGCYPKGDVPARNWGCCLPGERMIAFPVLAARARQN